MALSFRAALMAFCYSDPDPSSGNRSEQLFKNKKIPIFMYMYQSLCISSKAKLSFLLQLIFRLTSADKVMKMKNIIYLIKTGLIINRL